MQRDAIRREGRRPSDPGGDHDARALDRYEDEGGPGPEDTRGRRADAPTSELQADGATGREAAADGAREAEGRRITAVASDSGGPSPMSGPAAGVLDCPPRVGSAPRRGSPGAPRNRGCEP